VCLLPLVIKRQLKSLTIYSFLGFLTLLYIKVITIVYTFNHNVGNYFLDFEHLHAFLPRGSLVTFPIFIFSFTTQINLLQCFEELNRPTLRRMHKVLAKQHFICFSLYLFIGVFGYLSFPLDDPKSNSYIERYGATENFPVLVVVSSYSGCHPADPGHFRIATVLLIALSRVF
jgi:amino acid permease